MKNIALFIDGTWNKFRARGETNVFRLYKMAESCSDSGQVCHYISGVGTGPVKYKSAGISRTSNNAAARAARAVIGGLSGYGIGDKIKEGYAFLAKHYERNADDRVYLFGFSRGAFAARSLAGFVNVVGLLLKEHLDLVPRAYEIYEQGGSNLALRNFITNALGGSSPRDDAPIKVYFIGVWDTVGALGLPPPFDAFSFNADHHKTLLLPPNVSHARHALALHELRPVFAPAPWTMIAGRGQTLEQVWFAGAHADVGGGYEKSSLADIPLLWMANEAIRYALKLNLACYELICDVTSDIHHAIRGPFAMLTPQCRQVLKQLLTNPLVDTLATHSVHISALRRLEWIEARRKPYDFKRSIRDCLSEVDALTPRLALRTSEHLHGLPASLDKTDHVSSIQGLYSFAKSIDAQNPDHLQELMQRITVVGLTHGTEALWCMDDAVQTLSRECVHALSSRPTPNLARARHLTNQCASTLQALSEVSKTLPNRELRICVSVIALRNRLMQNASESRSSGKVVKI
jgi:uncharacterized protein (DUF2235 family)